MFGRQKLKRLTSQSVAIKRPDEINLVAQESDVNKQVLSCEIGVKENGAAVKIQTAFRGFLVRNCGVFVHVIHLFDFLRSNY